MFEAVRRLTRDVVERDESYWLVVLGAVAIMTEAISVGRAFLAPGRPPLGADTAFFQHAGWYVTTGAIPYVEIWDVKPPLTIETTTVFALLSGGDMYVLHALAVLFTTGTVVGTVVLVGSITKTMTDSLQAGFLAGLIVLTFPAYHYFAAFGFESKYPSIFFGLLGIYLLFEGRLLLSGLFAAGSAGYWQFGLLFAVLTGCSRTGRILRERYTGSSSGWPVLPPSLSYLSSPSARTDRCSSRSS